MININRVFAMFLRYLFYLRHSLDRLTDMFYWPAMDLFIWGLTGLYFISQNSNNPHVITIVLTGVIFWLVIWRAQYEININILAEIWDQGLINILASPLTIQEWATSFLLFGLFKAIISLAFAALLSSLLYHYDIFVYGFALLPVIISFLLTGWAIGFFVAALLLRYGERIQALAWTGIYIIAPFSALYYPVSVLPLWAQKIAAVIPSSYMFEGMREILSTGRMSNDKFIISFLLNFLYLFLSIWFFSTMFKKSKKLGFGRLL